MPIMSLEVDQEAEPRDRLKVKKTRIAIMENFEEAKKLKNKCFVESRCRQVKGAEIDGREATR